ncbi:MAG: ATP-binding protein [Pseudonocardia sp.]
MLSDALVPRRARRELEETLQVLRVAVLNGPRQAGKTTLARQLVGATGGSFVTLDDPATLQACLGDPRTFLTAYRKPLVVDEFQLAGDLLLRSVKSIVDTDLGRGQYLLTGSTRFLTVPSISESLAGRAGIVDLWPYTQGEAECRGDGADAFLAQLLEPDLPVRQLAEPPPSRASYLARICAGGFPEVQQLAGPAQRRRWFDAYIRTVTSRDVPGISNVQHVAELPKLLAALAAMTGQQLVVARLAEKVALSRQTVDRAYLPLLETVFMAVRLPAWSRNLLARVTRHPKSYVADSGVAAHLLNVDEVALADPMCAATGPLVETFVVNELIRQASFGGGPVQLAHYRTHDGIEVDVIAETPDGRVGGIEVKSSATVALADFRHLARIRDLLDASGGRFVRGVVLYTGDQVLPFGDRLVAMPLAALWMPAAE